jgi:hypothetical protein
MRTREAYGRRREDSSDIGNKTNKKVVTRFIPGNTHVEGLSI